jgi:hypothetical protein
MSTHIVQIGKHRFVSGLFWQSLSRPRELRKEAVELAKTLSLDLVTIRKEHGSAQAGFAHTADGAQRGMLSLAAAVAQQIAQKGIFTEGRHQAVSNWLGAFKLPDGKWAYFAVRDESFLPNGDFAGTKEEVLDRLNGDYGLGGWNIIIGDKELEEHGFHNFIAEKIENVVPRSKSGRIKVQRWWALTPVERRIDWKLAAVTAVVATIVVGGGTATWMYHKKQVEERERAAAMEAARNKLQSGELEAPHPWLAKPMPLVLARDCLDHLQHFSPGGWPLEEYACEAGQISYKWTRGASTVGSLLAAIPEAVVDLDGDKASWWQPLKLQASKDDVLLPSKELVMPLVTEFQKLGLPLKVTALPPPPPPPPGTEKNAAPRPTWQTFSFTAKAGGVPPLELASILTQPGVRLDKLSYRNGEWQIEGAIYAK